MVVTPARQEWRLKPRVEVDIYEGYEAIIPALETIIEGRVLIHNPKKVEQYGYDAKSWDIERVFPYTLSNGDVSHYVLRSIMKGQKIVVTVYWCKRPDGSEGWTTYKPEGDKRALYNLHAIKNNPGAKVYVTEGEKAAQNGY